MEIVLLLVGAAIFIISFFIPDRKTKQEDGLPDQEQLKKLVEQQVSEARDRIRVVVEENVKYAAERAEDSMNTLSNEKMMGLNEYSESVLDSIDKNHQEVLFLYDMLQEKSVDLKNTVREAQQLQKETAEKAREEKQSASALPIAAAPAAAPAAMPGAAPVAVSGAVPGAVPAAAPAAGRAQDKKKQAQPRPSGAPASPVEKLAEASARRDMEYIEAARPRERSAGDVDMALDEAASPGRNKNDMILKLHREGKSNVEIAKELGLGMGEVKLVISLYTV